MQTVNTAFEGELESAAEQMSVAHTVLDAVHALPEDLQHAVVHQAEQIWHLRGAYMARFLAAFSVVFGSNRTGFLRSFQQNPVGTARQLAVLAGQRAGVPRRQPTAPPGMSPVQVRQYRRRQQARGYVPGRSRHTSRSRELEHELELDRVSHELEFELELPEPFYTKVTPIPGIGNKEGHEILTRVAMRGLPLTATDRAAVELGVIRPDRGGRSYWNFPRAALGSLKAAAQPAHSLRPTPATPVPAALRSIQARFAGLYRRAMTAPTRARALGWIGEAMHLLQDSFSSAHVERAGGSGRIRHIRAFFLRFGWPPRSRAPLEHNAPSDTRDDVYLHGALRPEARAAIGASRALLVMALRHLRSPRSPAHAIELRRFIGRYLSM